jgi:hypothetical protein
MLDTRMNSCDNFEKVVTTSVRDVEVIAVWIKPKRKVEEFNAVPTCRWFKFAAFLDCISEG